MIRFYLFLISPFLILVSFWKFMIIQSLSVFLSRDIRQVLPTIHPYLSPLSCIILSCSWFSTNIWSFAKGQVFVCLVLFLVYRLFTHFFFVLTHGVFQIFVLTFEVFVCIYFIFCQFSLFEKGEIPLHIL